MSWAIDVLEPGCSIDIFENPKTGEFHAFVFWDGTKECASASSATPARAISQAYAKRASLWLGEPGEPLHPASVIEPRELIEPSSRSADLWLAIPCGLILLVAFLLWRLA